MTDNTDNIQTESTKDLSNFEGEYENTYGGVKFTTSQVQEGKELTDITEESIMPDLNSMAVDEQVSNSKVSPGVDTKETEAKTEPKSAPPQRRTVMRMGRLCELCGHESKSHSGYWYHMKTHTGEKPLKCDSCSYSCRAQHELKLHRRIHTGEKPFQCTYCGMTFRFSNSQRVHERIHTGEKPYKCSYCEKCFVQLGKKKTHERTHTGERPFLCQICGKSFIDTGERNRCQKAHMGIKRVRTQHPKPRVTEYEPSEQSWPYEPSMQVHFPNIYVPPASTLPNQFSNP